MNRFFSAGVLFVGLCLASSAGWAQSAVTGNAEKGRDKAQTCGGCHGLPEYKTAFPLVYRVPKIGGQNAAYIVAALQEYRKGDRTHPSMRALASSLSDQDMADIAAYYSQVK